ncbi:tetratricopeptide repeat protein [bacterium]|nr:tetratricopeptide repeat protein [bacterium]MBU1990310.1 tetratricopeptide repeat protein [bacterium]
MRTVLILFLLTAGLFARENETCYTVQLFSAPNTQENMKRLSGASYPSSCVLMEIGNTLTMRCGCYEKPQEAKKNLQSFEKKYTEAYVTSTYVYRFDKESQNEKSYAGLPFIKKQIQKPSAANISQRGKKLRGSEEELKLLLQVFLYQNDLANAYKTAKKGYQRSPKSYYWNQKMAEISRWSGRGDEAVKYMFFMYEYKHDAKIQSDLIDYGLSAYQYEKVEPLIADQAMKNPNKENIDKMLFVYSKLGTPEKAAVILEAQYTKDKANSAHLTRALQIYIDMGDLEQAQRIIQSIEKEKGYTSGNVPLIAYFYYLKRDLDSAYKSLFLSKEKVKDDDTKYLQLLSDLGWYMQDFAHAAEASKKLMMAEQARLIDYERILYVYKEKDLDLAAKAAIEGYEKYNVSYLFYGYTGSAMRLNKYKQLGRVLQEIDASALALKEESLYWLTKAEFYKYYNEIEKVKYALNRAYMLSPDDIEIKLTQLWFYMENNLDKELAKVLFDMAQDLSLDKDYYMSMASAYFYLQDVNKASFYLQKLIESKHKDTKSIDFKFLQAYVVHSQNNEGAFLQGMREIVESLEKEALKRAELKKENHFLSYYLRASMFVLGAEEYEAKLQEAKRYISEANYNEILYSWAVKNNSAEKSHAVFQKIKNKEVWMKFNNALMFQNHSEIENILDAYLGSLPINDAFQAAEQDGQIALSQTLAFEALDKNSDSQSGYMQHLNLSKEYGDRFESQISYYNRDPLLQENISLKNSSYLGESLYILTELQYNKNSILDNNILIKVPQDVLRAEMGIKRLFKRGHVALHVGIHQAMREYDSYALLGEYKVSTDLKANIGIEKNTDAQESVQLLLGGKKDMLSLELNWAFLDSASIDMLYEFNKYESQDEIFLGRGNYGRLSLTKQIRLGYPDISAGMFYDYGEYSDTQTDKGTADEIQKEKLAVLPEKFYNMGASFTYGMANSTAYTRVWRPYFSLNPYYNGQSHEYNFACSAGYGGALWHQDHLVFGASYTESVKGSGGSMLEIFLKYQFLYRHP